MRSLLVAAKMRCSPQYIRYLPFIFETTNLLGSVFDCSVRIAADLQNMFMYFPPFAFLNALPCFFQVRRSFDVAMQRRAHFLFQLV